MAVHGKKVKTMLQSESGDPNACWLGVIYFGVRSR